MTFIVKPNVTEVAMVCNLCPIECGRVGKCGKMQ